MVKLILGVICLALLSSCTVTTEEWEKCKRLGESSDTTLELVERVTLSKIVCHYEDGSFLWFHKH